MKKFTNNSSYKIIQYSDGIYPDLAYDMHASFELDEYDVINAESEYEIIELIKYNKQVDAIVTYSKEDSTKFKILIGLLPMEYKRKWYHFNDYEKHGNEIGWWLANSQLTKYDAPFFSMVTPLYNTNIQYFASAYESFMNQTFGDWEWVLLDDSPEPLQNIKDYIDSKDDIRVKYYRIEQVTEGCIGLAKWRANCMSKGKWLIEFDHDDMLPYWALEELKKGIDMYPDAGFIYTDDAPITADNNFQNYTYGEEYGLGYEYPYASDIPSHKFTIITNRDCNMNQAGLRHIVGVPNHIRCWKREVYFNVGGHNTNLRIADDYELVVRTWLNTPFIHVNAPCYFQRFDGNNSQGAGNNRADIQRRVRWISNFYNDDIHNKILELGGTEDYYNEKDSFDTMHHYYGLSDIKHFNYEYTPEWQTYPFQVTSQEAKKYRENLQNK